MLWWQEAALLDSTKTPCSRCAVLCWQEATGLDSSMSCQKQPAAGCTRANGGNTNQPAAGTSSDKCEGKFECEECGKTFPSGRVLLFHKRAHTSDGKHQCKECGQRFTLEYNFDLHMQTHNTEGYHKCGKCGQTFTKKCDFDIHMLTHRAVTKYKCDKCWKRFSLKCSFDKHSLSHTGTRDSEVEVSGARKTQEGSLGTGHIPQPSNKYWRKVKQQSIPRTFRFAHFDTRNFVREGNTDKLKQESGPDTDPFANTDVKYGFDNSEDINEDGSLNIDPRAHTRGQYECDECHKTFMTKGGLRQHGRSHTETYKCEECGKMFNYIEYFKRHMHRFKVLGHYKCKDCGIQFRAKCSLNEHYQKSHPSRRPIQCNKCGKRFSCEPRLADHLLRHTGLRKFKCDLCGMSFKTRPDIVSHIRHRHLPKSVPQGRAVTQDSSVDGCTKQ